MQSGQGVKGVYARPAPRAWCAVQHTLPGRAGEPASSFAGQSIWTRYDLLGETRVRGPLAACAACQLTGRNLPARRSCWACQEPAAPAAGPMRWTAWSKAASP